jgi:hypothetical protein
MNASDNPPPPSLSRVARAISRPFRRTDTPRSHLAAMELPEAVRDEIELLEMTYEGRLARDDGAAEVSLALGTAGESALATVAIDFGVPGYPDDAPPCVRVIKSVGLSDEQCGELQAVIEEAAAEYVGMPSGAVVATMATEFLEGIHSSGFHCLICLEDEPCSDLAFVPSCGHSFHKGCFSRWVHAQRRQASAGNDARAQRARIAVVERHAHGSLRAAEEQAAAAQRQERVALARVEAAQAWCERIRAVAASSAGPASSAPTSKRGGGRRRREEAEAVSLTTVPLDETTEFPSGVTPEDAQIALGRVETTVKERMRAHSLALQSVADSERRLASQRAESAAQLAHTDEEATRASSAGTPCPACGGAVPSDKCDAILAPVDEAAADEALSEADRRRLGELTRLHLERTERLRGRQLAVRERLGWSKILLEPVHE